MKRFAIFLAAWFLSLSAFGQEQMDSVTRQDMAARLLLGIEDLSGEYTLPANAQWVIVSVLFFEDGKMKEVLVGFPTACGNRKTDRLLIYFAWMPETQKCVLILEYPGEKGFNKAHSLPLKRQEVEKFKPSTFRICTSLGEKIMYEDYQIVGFCSSHAEDRAKAVRAGATVFERDVTQSKYVMALAVKTSDDPNFIRDDFTIIKPPSASEKP